VQRSLPIGSASSNLPFQCSCRSLMAGSTNRIWSAQHQEKGDLCQGCGNNYIAEEAEVWSECVEQVVFGLVYKDYDFRTAKRPPSSVNRHGILHGRI
jgi:hypothetical protein